MGRAPCCDKSRVKKGPWSPEEDAKLKSYIDHNGTGGNWIALPQKIGLKRCGKSCRLRWLNYLRPNIKHGGFSQEEDNLICTLYITIGSRWSIIAAQLPGRTDNDIKNYWNTRLKKKLLGSSISKAAGKHRRAPGLINTRISTTNSATPPPLPPIPNYSNEADQEPEARRFNDYAAIRNLLTSLGGRFSTHIHDHEYTTTTTAAAFDEPLNIIQPPQLAAPSYNIPLIHQLPLLINTMSSPGALMNIHALPGADQFEAALVMPHHPAAGPDLFYDDGVVNMDDQMMNCSINFTGGSSNSQGCSFLQGSMLELADYFASS